jgi:membrane protein YqaA with SNARE-associated domain
VTDLIISEPSPWLRRAAYSTLALVAIVSALAFVFATPYRDLIGYGLYVIPAHLLISFLPHEPAILYVAKLYPPQLIATVGTIGCVVAGILDYWLIGWFVSQGLIRSKLDESRIYRIAHRIFKKAPFLLIIGSAMAPVPFYPVKIMAIASGYSFVRFVTAVVLGRWPRFYLLAIGGREFQAPNSWLLGAAVLLEVLTIVGIWRTRRSSGSRSAPDET